MVKTNMGIRLKAVILSLEGVKTDKEICADYCISDRTLRRWKTNYRKAGVEGLEPVKPVAKRVHNKTPKYLQERILRLKQKYPSWGARRIKHQFNLPISWRTVHNIIKNNGLLIRIKAKPQPSKRFQRKHVDSLWQGDTFQFRIHDVGKVYVTGFTDDCSRFRVRSKVYLNKGAKESVNALQWALKAGRIPRAIYLDKRQTVYCTGFQGRSKKARCKTDFRQASQPKR